MPALRGIPSWSGAGKMLTKYGDLTWEVVVISCTHQQTTLRQWKQVPASDVYLQTMTLTLTLTLNVFPFHRHAGDGGGGGVRQE